MGNVILQESQWFSVDYNYAGSALRDVVDNYKNYEVMGKKQATIIRKEFSFEAMADKVNKLLDQYVPEFPTQTQLKLPQLKKIELPKLKKA